MNVQSRELSVLVLVVVRVSSLAGFSKVCTVLISVRGLSESNQCSQSVLVICALWVLPSSNLGPRRSRHNKARGACPRRGHPSLSDANPNGEAKVSILEDPQVKIATPVCTRKRNRKIVRSLGGVRNVLASVVSHVARPVCATQRKVFRRRSVACDGTDAPVDSKTASQPRRPSLPTSRPSMELPIASGSRLSVSPIETAAPRELFRKRNPSFVLRQRFAHAAANAATAFRKRRASDPSVPPSDSGSIPSVVPVGPQTFPGRLEDVPAAPSKPVRRKTSITIKWHGVPGRTRASSLVSPLCTPPIMEACDSNATVTLRTV